MGDDFWKLVVPVVGALVVGVLLHVLKEGGIRRLRRRNITEELELLELLAEHPEPAARIRRRVDVMLAQYEPEQPSTKRRKVQWQRVSADLVAVIVTATVAVEVFDPTSTWQSFAIGGVLAIAYMTVDGWLTRRRDRGEQDRAVDQVVLGGMAEENDLAPGGAGVADPPKG